MGIFRINVTAVNAVDDKLKTEPVSMIVDTGAECTWFPNEVLRSIGVKPMKKIKFLTATTELVEREAGYAVLRADGFETIDEVVFGQANDAVLLGARAVEGFGVMVDNINKRFVAATRLVV
jgi:predicted aspartyl protease